MIKIAILDDYDGSISGLDCWRTLPSGFSTDFFSTAQGPEQLKEYDVIVTVRERTRITREFLSETKNLKHLALTGRLSGQADLEALKERGIAVSYTDGSGQSAAELTIALLLGLTKGLADRHQALRTGGWQIGPGRSLSGKTLGVLGLGRIGTQVAQFGKLMKMNVVSWGPSPDQGRSEKYGLERLELAECLRRSDVLTLCLRLSDKTRGLLGTAQLGLLKDGACLVNTSRAEIIDKNALYAELSSERIFAALDVFHEEPLPSDDPVRGFSNVLLSPHMGYVTQEVYQTFFTQVVQNILAWSSGKEYKNAVAAGN